MAKWKRCRPGCIALSLTLFLIWPGGAPAQTSWDFEPAMPSDDPLWEEVASLWQQHRTDKTYDSLINTLEILKEKNPGRIEPLLWLGKIHFMKGALTPKKADEAHLRTAIQYALEARKIEPENKAAFRVLVSCLPKFGDLEYAMAHYGDWINEAKPLAADRALPEITKNKQWKEAFQAWDNRAQIEEGKKAVAFFKEAADREPEDGPVQIWTCRGMYYLGYYYMAEREEAASLSYFKQGVTYGENALKVLPDSVAANYWYAINYGRTIEGMSIFEKAVKFRPLLDHTLYCARENPSYFYYGPVLVMGTTMTRGGWVVKKVMGRIGVTLGQTLNALEMAEVLYPEYLYIPFSKAEIFSETGRQQEAREILKGILTEDVNGSPLHSAENRLVMKLSSTLLDKLAP